MIINGTKLLKAAPIKDMSTVKTKYKGTSWGLAEAGYDIRLSENIEFYPNLKTSQIYLDDVRKSGNFTLASAQEYFQMPTNLVGVVHDKSTWARQGVSVFNTVIEPGWNGFLTLEIVFHGNKPMKMYAGQGIAQVLFSEIAEEGDYGDGKYQNQEKGPIEARS